MTKKLYLQVLRTSIRKTTHFYETSTFIHLKYWMIFKTITTACVIVLILLTKQRHCWHGVWAHIYSMRIPNIINYILCICRTHINYYSARPKSLKLYHLNYIYKSLHKLAYCWISTKWVWREIIPRPIAISWRWNCYNIQIYFRP